MQSAAADTGLCGWDQLAWCVPAGSMVRPLRHGVFTGLYYRAAGKTGHGSRGGGPTADLCAVGSRREGAVTAAAAAAAAAAARAPHRPLTEYQVPDGLEDWTSKMSDFRSVMLGRNLFLRRVRHSRTVCRTKSKSGFGQLCYWF